MKLVKIFFFGYLILFPFGQLLRFPPQSTQLSEVHFYLTDVFVFGLVLFWLAKKILGKEPFLFPALTKPIFLFLGFCAFSLIFNFSFLEPRQFLVSLLYLFRFLVYAGIYFVVADLVHDQVLKKERIENGLLAVGFVCAILGLLQYFILPDTRFLSDYGWDPHYYRLLGTFLDPGFLGAILVLTLILWTLRIWSVLAKWDKKKILLWLVVYLALALTYSRASYLAYLTAMALISWQQRSLKFLLAVLVGGLITIFLLPRPGGEGVRLERQSTIQFRVVSWQHSVLIAKDHPLFGVGFNAYRYAQKKYGYLDDRVWQFSHGAAGADSSLLFVLATTGLFGLLAYFWLLGKTFLLKSFPIVVSLAALLVHSCFQNSLFYPWIMGWWWILLGFFDLKPQKAGRASSPV